jgi:hypothetical protein
VKSFLTPATQKRRQYAIRLILSVRSRLQRLDLGSGFVEILADVFEPDEPPGAAGSTRFYLESESAYPRSAHVFSGRERGGLSLGSPAEYHESEHCVTTRRPVPGGWSTALMDRSDTRDGGDEAQTPRPAPILSIDELRSVVFIIRCARVIGFLQRFVPGKYLPPPEDRIPPSLLRRLIHELKTLIPKWKWTPSAGALPRSPAKLGDEFFCAITALRMSRLELWRAGYKDCVAALDDAYSLLFSIGIRARERKSRAKSKQPDGKGQ